MQNSIAHKAAPYMVIAVSLVVNFDISVNASRAQDKSPAKTAAADATTDAAKGKSPPAPPKLPEPKGAKRLSQDYPVWLDPKENAVLVDGQIALREGMLEMFACTRNTKEHESIVSANTKAFIVHAGLLSLGAEAGHPVQFRPEYKPPTGTEIEVLVRWIDEKGKEHTARAQDWVKDLRTGKPMAYPFVFAGSGFWVDPDTGKQHYQAEGGYFVCVSNFGTAMLDIPVKSSQSNEDLEFQAITEKIPPLGAPVRLVFKPKLKKQGAVSGEPGPESKNQKNEKSNGAAAKSAGKAK